MGAGVSGRIPYIFQSHSLWALLRQMGDDERRNTLAEMVLIAKTFRDNPQTGPMERKAALQIVDTAERSLTSAEPLDPWVLGHVIIDWGLLDLTRDLGSQFAKRQTTAAKWKRLEAGAPLRNAALADIAANPRTSQGACAKRLAGQFAKGERHVNRVIKDLFSEVILPGGKREKRPRPEFLPPPAK